MTPNIVFLKPELCISAVASGLVVSVKAAPRPTVQLVQTPVPRPLPLS